MGRRIVSCDGELMGFGKVWRRMFGQNDRWDVMKQS